MDNLEWQAGLLVAAVIAILLWAFHAKTRAWSHPAVVFAAFWLVMTLAPLLTTPQLALSFYAFGYISLAVAAFGAPALLYDWQLATATIRHRQGSHDALFGSRRFLAAFLVLQATPLICIALNLHKQGFALSAFADPLRLNCEYLAARYSGQITTNYFTAIGTVANYVGAPLGGMILANRKGYALPFVILLASFLPGLINMVAYADKGTVFLTVAYFYGGVIVGRVARGDTSLITMRTIFGGAALGMVIAPLLALALINRSAVVGACDTNTRTAQVLGGVAKILKHEPATTPGVLDPSERLLFSIRSYAVGSQFAFSHWFDDYAFGGGSTYKNPSSLTFGRYTFIAIAKILDKPWAATVPEGYYDEYFKGGTILQTNIFKMFRGLIYDFGIAGSLLFMALAGALANTCYRRMLATPHPVIAQAIYTSFLAFTYYTSLISLFTWNSPIAALAAVALILAAFQLPARYNVAFRPHSA